MCTVAEKQCPQTKASKGQFRVFGEAFKNFVTRIAVTSNCKPGAATAIATQEIIAIPKGENLKPTLWTRDLPGLCVCVCVFMVFWTCFIRLEISQTHCDHKVGFS